MANIVQTVTSECGCYKVEIEQRSESAFKLTALQWREEWVEDQKIHEGWITVKNTNLVFTDTLESAEQLAAEILRTLLY